MTRIRETRTEITPPRRSRPRAGAAAFAVLVAGVLAAVLLTVLVALGVKDDLERGRAELRSGRVALLAGRLDEAIASFNEARGRFDSAADRAGSWPGAIPARIPLLGRTID